jgi:hypothetical protein
MVEFAANAALVLSAEDKERKMLLVVEELDES